MVDEVRREIERIRGYISNGRLTQFDETNTKAIAIEPVLRELGWDVVDPDEVRREYSVGSRSVDYALFCDDTLKVFIEAKRGGESLERHQEQLVRYAFDEGVEIAILTNGATWWFFLPIRAVSWERRKVATLELNQQDSTEIAQRFIDLLSKENVCSGRAIQNAEKHQILEALPEIWNRLVSEADSSIVNLLAERTHKLCVREPDRDEVEQFLFGHLEQIQITSIPSAPEPAPAPESIPTLGPDSTPEPKPSVSMKGKKINAFTFCGHRHEVTTWISMLVRLCELVYSAQKNRFDEVLNLRATPRSKPWFSKNSKDFRECKQIDRTSIVVDSNKTADEIVVIAKNLITHFGYNKGDDWSFDIE